MSVQSASQRLTAAVKRGVPQQFHSPLRSAYYAAYRKFLNLQWWILDRFEKSAPPAEFTLPPAKLRFRVAEDASASLFIRIGQRTAEDLQSVLARTNFALDDGVAALDFGCGCGRTLLWLTRQFPSVRWHGTDADIDAILWCRKNIPNGIFSVNEPLPPLPYPDDSFDLIYGISVFTHLSRDYQRAWVPELYRVLKPGGSLLLTFYAKHVWQAMDDAGAVERNEFVFRTSTKMKGILPEWYQTALQSQSLAIGLLSGRFGEVTCFERGFGDQDVLVSRK